MGFADVGDVEDRLDFELNEKELRIADARLDDAADMANHLAGKTDGFEWTINTVPRVVRTATVNAVVRYMQNPDAMVQSRAGDETIIWSDRGEAGSFYFTKAETEMLKSFQVRPGLGSISVTPWRTKARAETIFVHTDPVLAGDVYPWLDPNDPIVQGP